MESKLQMPFQANVGSTMTFLRRALPIAAVALAMMSLTLLVACGGGNGDNGSSNGSASTPGSSAATPAAQAATQPPATAEVAPAAVSGTEELFVGATNFGIFELNLSAGVTASVTYSSVGLSTGGITTGGKFAAESGAGSAEGDVILTVLNPIEEQILNVDRMGNNTVEFQADHTGAYQLVFANPYRLQGLQIILDYVINP